MDKLLKNKKRLKGFTLVELLAVIVILAILLIIAIPAVISIVNTSRGSTFVEYVDKVGSLSQQKFLGEYSDGYFDSCIMYNIEADLDLDDTGTYHGYVLVVPGATGVEYYMTLYNEEFMIINYKFGNKLDTSKLEKYKSDDERLSADYLCAQSYCTTCNIVDDETSNYVTCSGSECDIKCVGDDCINKCTGDDCNTICPDDNPDCKKNDPDEPILTCKGLDCEIQCIGPDCENTCVGDECKKTCTGDFCDTFEDEDTCNYEGCDQSCTGDDCEVTCKGSDCKTIICPTLNPDCSVEPVCTGKDCEEICIGPSCEIECLGKDCEKINPDGYYLSFSIRGSGTVSPTNATLKHGGSATFKVTPSQGSYLSNIVCNYGYTVSGASFGNSHSESQNITVTNSSIYNGNCVITFAKRSYYASFESNDIFKFEKNKISVPYAGTNTVNVTGGTGYTLNSLSCTNGYTGSISGPSGDYTATINNNRNYNDSVCTVAEETNYTRNSYTVNLASDSIGKLSTNSLEIAFGKTGSYKTTISDGYYLSTVSFSGEGYSASANFGVSATGTQTITLKNNDYDSGTTAINIYGVKSYAANITTSGSGSVSKKSMSIPYNSSNTFTATPSTGYYIGSVSCTNGYSISGTTGTSTSGSTITYTVKNNSSTNTSTCTVQFNKNTYNVSVGANPSTYGKVSKSSVSIKYGESATFTATPNAGYKLSAVSCNNRNYKISAASYGASATTVTINNNNTASGTTCTATFIKISATVTVQSSNTSMGTVNTSSLTIGYGGSKTFTATPKTGYYISSVSCTNGYTTNAKTGSSYTSAQEITVKNNNTANGSICTVSFSKKSYAVTIKVDSNSKATISSSSISVPYGDSNTFTAYSINGYYITSVSCSDSKYSASFTKTVSKSTLYEAPTVTIKNNNSTSETTCTVYSSAVSADMLAYGGTNGCSDVKCALDLFK